MMKAVGSSEMFTNFYETTQCNIIEDSHLCNSESIHNFLCLLQEQARLLTVGSTETYEPASQKTT
jgi:hypothetical protein